MIDYTDETQTTTITVIVAALSLLALPVTIALADGYQATQSPLARSLTAEQIDRVVDAAPADTTVGLPGWYAKQAPAFRDIGTNSLAKAAVPALGLVIEDTRANIPETAGMTDVEIAALYLKQMQKPYNELAKLAPTNSLEYLIGAGMRADIQAAKEGDK